MPPHELVLKVGAIAKIMRNISPTDGLFNGTRVKIDAINTRAKTVVVTKLHDLSRSDGSSTSPDTQQHIIGQINFEQYCSIGCVHCNQTNRTARYAHMICDA